MSRLYITREHLDRVGMASQSEVADNAIVAGVSIATSTGLGVLVGYRHASGKTDEEAMPGLGPVPLDAMIGLGGLVGGIFMRGKLGKAVLGAGIGGSNVFGMSAGQSLGAMLFEKMQGTGGEMALGAGKQQTKQLGTQAPGFRDMNGNFHPGVKKGTGGELVERKQAAPSTDDKWLRVTPE